MRFNVLMLVFMGLQANAQFSGSNLLEYQYGKLPNEGETTFHGAYTKPILNYRWDNIKATAGFQIYQSPYAQRNYNDVSWLSVNYKSKGLEIGLGNFNSTLERGVLLRSYEVHGALLEDLSYRGKHYFYKDILGATAKFRWKKGSVRVLWGHVLNNIFPPSLPYKDRRSDEIAGFSTSLKLPKNHTIGMSSILVRNQTEESYYGSGNISGKISKNLTYYFLYAKKLNAVTTDSKAHALYGNLNFSSNNFGLSAEWKDYDNFLIGSGINEPPALVKEHTYRVLNRTTHVLNPDNESGVQLEAYYNVNDTSTITLNYTKATIDSGIKFNYQEWYAEYSGAFSKKTDFRVFVDHANDELKNHRDRLSSGFTLNHMLPNNIKSLTLEVNGQTFKRSGINIRNFVSDLTVRYKSKLFLSLLYEWSNDTFLTDSTRIWLGTTLNYKINSKNTFSIFGGERRGGPACNAGVCYEILDFKGVEVRWVSRF